MRQSVSEKLRGLADTAEGLANEVAKYEAERVLPEGRLAALPGHKHLRWHMMQVSKGHSLVEAIEMLPALLKGITLDEVAVEMGPGVTRRMVETVMYRWMDALGIASGTQRTQLIRMKLLRIAMGLDVCCGVKAEDGR